MQILLIEDDNVDAMIIKRWLKDHDVTWVDNAAKAMATDRTQFDLILCDMNLPDAIDTGSASTTVTEILSQLPTPIVRISGHFREGIVEKTQETILAAVAHWRAFQNTRNDSGADSA